jgi:hypothetical protein
MQPSKAEFVAAEQAKSNIERREAFEHALQQKKQSSLDSEETIFQQTESGTEKKVCDWGRDSVRGIPNVPDDLGEGIEGLEISSTHLSKLKKVFHGPIHPPEDIEDEGGRQVARGGEAAEGGKPILNDKSVDAIKSSQSLLQNLFEWSDVDGDGIISDPEYQRLFEIIYQANTGRSELGVLTADETKDMLQLGKQEFEHDSKPQPDSAGKGGIAVGLNREQFDQCFCQLLVQGVKQADFETYLRNVLKMTLDHQMRQ